MSESARGHAARAILGILLLGFSSCAKDPEPSMEPSTAKGHQEVVIGEDDNLTPLSFHADRSFALCYAASPDIDTSTWRLEISFDGLPSPEGAKPVTERSESTACFKAEPADAWAERLSRETSADQNPTLRIPIEICGRWRDAYSGEERDAGCVAAFYRSPTGYENAREQRRELLGRVKESTSRSTAPTTSFQIPTTPRSSTTWPRAPSTAWRSPIRPPISTRRKSPSPSS